MDINKTRLGLIYIFSENEKISKKAKLHLINFIEQADEHQLKVLMMDGEIISKDKLDEQAREIVNDRFSALPELEIALEKASVEGIVVLTEAMGTAINAGRYCRNMFPNDEKNAQNV